MEHILPNTVRVFETAITYVNTHSSQPTLRAANGRRNPLLDGAGKGQTTQTNNEQKPTRQQKKHTHTTIIKRNKIKTKQTTGQRKHLQFEKK